MKQWQLLLLFLIFVALISLFPTALIIGAIMIHFENKERLIKGESS